MSRFEILVYKPADSADSHEPAQPIDYTGFLAEFRRCNWLNETNRAFWARRFSPEIFVRNAKTHKGLSVTSHDVLSAARGYEEPTLEGMIDFVLIPRKGIEATAANTPLFGFITPRETEVEMAYLLFFSDQDEALNRHLSTLLAVEIVDEDD